MDKYMYLVGSKCPCRRPQIPNVRSAASAGNIAHTAVAATYSIAHPGMPGIGEWRLLLLVPVTGGPR